MYFGALIFEWLKRFSGLVLTKNDRNEIRRKFLKVCFENEIFLKTEYRVVLQYFRYSDDLLFLHIPLLRNWLESTLRKKMPYLIGENLLKKQGVYSYDKKLPI
jgi:hypothetical protein